MQMHKDLKKHLNKADKHKLRQSLISTCDQSDATMLELWATMTLDEFKTCVNDIASFNNAMRDVQSEGMFLIGHLAMMKMNDIIERLHEIAREDESEANHGH